MQLKRLTNVAKSEIVVVKNNFKEKIFRKQGALTEND